MTNVTRYAYRWMGQEAQLIVGDDGAYVLFTDYQAKCLEVERLRKALEWAELALEEIDERDVNEFGLRAIARIRLAEVRAKYDLAPAAGNPEEADEIAAARKAKKRCQGERWSRQKGQVRTVRRDGTHALGGHRTSHVSGKRSGRFAAKIKDNLDKQVSRLNRELADRKDKSDD